MYTYNPCLHSTFTRRKFEKAYERIVYVLYVSVTSLVQTCRNEDEIAIFNLFCLRFVLI